MIHEYLIDDEGRRWCADDCPGEQPHWNGEPEDVFDMVVPIVPPHLRTGNRNRA